MFRGSLVRTLAIASLACALLVGNFAFAQSNKAPTPYQNTEQPAEDPALKLSIEELREELRKEYPISLLDKKKKNYKPGQKINIDDYSIAEIKAAFLNADKNFISKGTSEQPTNSSPRN